MANTFLQAEWRKLAMVNYAVDPNLLASYLPAKTEIDLWNDTCYISLVGFMFKNTRVKGFKIPFHINFEEVNLRFYVRYKDNDTWKRGVVFIKEIVPRAALTFVANTVYGENYQTMPMVHSWVEREEELTIEYKWKKRNWHSLKIKADSNPVPIMPGSEAEFITEHYWGYTKISNTQTAEYEVKHPKWEIYPIHDYWIDVDFAMVYGSEFNFLKNEIPRSVFLAEGSAISVMQGRKI